MCTWWENALDYASFELRVRAGGKQARICNVTTLSSQHEGGEVAHPKWD